MDLNLDESVGILVYVANLYRDILIDDVNTRPRNVTEGSVNLMIELIDIAVKKCTDVMDDGALIL